MKKQLPQMSSSRVMRVDDGWVVSINLWYDEFSDDPTASMLSGPYATHEAALRGAMTLIEERTNDQDDQAEIRHGFPEKTLVNG